MSRCWGVILSRGVFFLVASPEGSLALPPLCPPSSSSLSHLALTHENERRRSFVFSGRSLGAGPYARQRHTRPSGMHGNQPSAASNRASGIISFKECPNWNPGSHIQKLKCRRCREYNRGFAYCVGSPHANMKRVVTIAFVSSSPDVSC